MIEDVIKEVVNCFQFSIFAFAKTTAALECSSTEVL